MNGSSLDLSVIGYLVLKHGDRSVFLLSIIINTIIPCSIPSAEMLTTLKFLIRITTLLLISAHDPGGQTQIMYCALQQESLHFHFHHHQWFYQRKDKHALFLATCSNSFHWWNYWEWLIWNIKYVQFNMTEKAVVFFPHSWTNDWSEKIKSASASFVNQLSGCTVSLSCYKCGVHFIRCIQLLYTAIL